VCENTAQLQGFPLQQRRQRGLVADKTHYEILELGTDAPMEDVRAAHERLSRSIDAAGPDGKARLNALNDALATLTDPGKRARYDMGMAAREKPASEQIAIIEPSLSPRTIAVAAIVVLLGGVTFTFYQQKAAREEAAQAAVAQAAAQAKQAADRAKADQLEAQEYERARRSAELSAADQTSRGAERVRRRDEAEKRAQTGRDKQKQDAKDQKDRDQFLRSGREAIENNKFIDYSRLPNPPLPADKKGP
jgi:hypothetical protein